MDTCQNCEFYSDKFPQRLNGLATLCVGTAVYNVTEGRKEDEKDVSSYWMILRKGKDT